jgi:hypothetical protein
MGISNMEMEALTIVASSKDLVDSLKPDELPEDAFDIGVITVQLLATSQKLVSVRTAYTFFSCFIYRRQLRRRPTTSQSLELLLLNVSLNSTAEPLSKALIWMILSLDKSWISILMELLSVKRPAPWLLQTRSCLLP